MSRIVTVGLNVQLILAVDEEVEIQEVINELEYNFLDTTTQAEVLDQTISGFELIYSK